MPSIDVFKDDAFSMMNLTAAINKAPFKPARIAQLRLFDEKRISTTRVMVEEKQGQLTLIPTTPRGGVPDTIGKDARKVRDFSVPHLARESTIYADEIQGVRAFGSETDLQVMQTIVNDRLASLRSMHEVTLEYHRIGAIKGLILDADGTSTIYNLFDQFNVVQQTADFAFTTTTTDVRKKCIETIRLIEDELGAATYTGIRAFCSAGFFDALVGHDSVKEAFKYQEAQTLRDDLRNSFRFGGIQWEEYRGSVGGVKFVEDDAAYVFPDGATVENGASLFQTSFAPADFVETVNTLGLPLYAKQHIDEKFQRFVELHTQQNPLCLCLRPRAVIKLSLS